MNLISIVFSLIKQTSFFLIYYLSFLFPRNKKVWLYGNYQGTFRDNSKYLYLFGNEKFPEIKHIWVTPSTETVERLTNLGYHAVYKYSIKALYYALRAKVYIYNIYPTTDIYNGCFRGSAFLFNLWHGVPYKKIEYDVKTGPLRPLFNPDSFKERFFSFLRDPKAFKKSTAVLATSVKLVNIYSSAFQLPKDKIFVGPYPRNSVFELSKSQLLKYISKVESLQLQQAVEEFTKFDKVVIFMPTFRDTNYDFMSLAIPDFDRLHELCRQYNLLFVIKAHILTKYNVDLSQYTHIKNLDPTIDVYPVLPFTDGLISDYSSIIFDYALLKKKIIFYAFDKEEYLSKSREAYFEYEEVFTENYTKDFSSLLEEVRSVGMEEKGSVHNYPLSSSFLENDADLNDIINYIRRSIGV